jgi:hypothetical protein
MTTTYTIEPENKNCIYEEEHYNKKLSTGKRATILYTKNWRWGSFEITLTDEEKEEVEKSDDISLNSYDTSCNELTEGWFESVELKNESDYSEEEKSEILLSICSDEEEDVCYDNCDIDSMEENGWCLDDTKYSIVSGCILEE